MVWLKRYLWRLTLFSSFGFLGKISFLDDRQIPDRMKKPVSFMMR